MDDCLHQWDERFHALVSKNMLKHPMKPTLYETPVLKYDYKQWYSNHIWLHKQPLPLWLITSSYAAFGVSEFSTRLPSLIFSLLAIYITFLLGKNFFSAKTGILAAFFMCINGLVLELGSGRIATDHYELLFMVFIEISILFAYYNSLKKTLSLAVLSGIFMGCAVITKWLPCLVILPIHYCFLKNTNSGPKEMIKQLGFSLLACILVSAPWQIYILYTYPLESRWEYFHHWLHVIEELEGRTDNGYLYFIDKIRMNYSEIVYLPLLYFGYKLSKPTFKNYNLIALFIWIFLPIIFFSFVKTKMQGYILFVCPALFILTAAFFFELKENTSKLKDRKGLAVLSWLVLLAILVLPIRYCYERTAFGLNAPACVNYIAYYKAIQAMPEKSIVLNVQHPVDFMFYNNCTAYTIAHITEQEKDSLIKTGFSLYVYNTETNSINPLK